MSKVIVDTSVWIQFFNIPESHEKREVDALLTYDRVTIAGVIISELLQGAKSQEDFREIKDKISILPYLKTSKDTWIKVGEISFKLRKQGISLPFTDIFIATLARENNYEVYTLDSHFKEIPRVKLYSSNTEM